MINDKKPIQVKSIDKMYSVLLSHINTLDKLDFYDTNYHNFLFMMRSAEDLKQICSSNRRNVITKNQKNEMIKDFEKIKQIFKNNNLIFLNCAISNLKMLSIINNK